MVEGPSLADLVRAAAPDVDAEMRARLDATAAAMQRLKDTADSGAMAYDQMLGESNPEGNAIVQEAVDALKAQTRVMEQAAVALGVESLEIRGLRQPGQPGRGLPVISPGRRDSFIPSTEYLQGPCGRREARSSSLAAASGSALGAGGRNPVESGHERGEPGAAQRDEGFGRPLAELLGEKAGAVADAVHGAQDGVGLPEDAGEPPFAVVDAAVVVG